MNFVGDFFALGLVFVLGMFFFDSKHALSKASRYYVGALMLTALTALSNLATGFLLSKPAVPLWLNIAVNSLYFCINLLATSSIALYLFAKILEHSHVKHCMRNAKTALLFCYAVYLVIIIANLWTGWIFYFNENNEYCRGPLNAVGYLLTVCQMLLVTLCYYQNKHHVSMSVRRVLIQTFPVIIMCIVIQRMYPEIMLNSFIMSMVDTVLFLTYHGQRQGVHILTKLNDRHRFFESIDEHIKNHSPFQVFLINIKNFGVINQKFGHLFGDEVLYQFAFALEKLIRNSEAFHMNGTVFTLLFPYFSQHTAEKYLQTVFDFLNDGITCANDHIQFEYILVEYIAAEDEPDTEAFYEKLEYAALKTYQNKKHYIRYTDAIGDEMRRHRYLIERMKNISGESGFEVWYQPIKSLSSKGFNAMEALIRLREPDGTAISPAEFIPIAEETGMAAPITWFVLEQVCQTLHANPWINDLRVGINLSMLQLLEPIFISRLNSIVDSYGIDHRCIALEFTERSISDNFEQIRFVMNEIRMQGYSFYLDDFGSGYSNFNCLLRLPFDVVKLDTDLIHLDLGRNGEHNYGLTSKLISFLHEANTRVVAEGVETESLARLLEELQTDQIQGYFYAKPMPCAEMLAFLREHLTSE